MITRFTTKYSLGQRVWFRDKFGDKTKASVYEIQCMTIHHNPITTEIRYFLMGWFRQEDLYETHEELLADHPDII